MRVGSRIFCALLVALELVALIVGLTMATAMKRSVNHLVGVLPDEQVAIAISLSDTVYSVRFGYVGLSNVFDTIQQFWNEGVNNWSNLEILKTNFRNARVLNARIKAAASWDHRRLAIEQPHPDRYRL